MTGAVVGAGGDEAEDGLARRRRNRKVTVVVTLVLFVVTGLIVTALSSWGQPEQQHVSTFRAENQYQQIAHDVAMRSAQRSAADGLRAETFAASCRLFAAQASSSTSDFYGERSAALAGCIDGLYAFYPGE